MKVSLYGRFGQFPHNIAELVEKSGFVIVENETPDLIITYGGDGTLVGSERDFPGVPKLPIKNSHVCKRCVPLTPEQTLQAFADNQLDLKEFVKLEAHIGSEKYLALNDVIVRNVIPNTALRFQIQTSDSQLLPNDLEIIGDGVVVATPFGSTGYFFSITQKTFSEGIGIALNNPSHEVIPRYFIVGDEDEIIVKITREEAILAFDNNPKLIKLAPPDVVKIKKFPEPAKIYTLPT